MYKKFAGIFIVLSLTGCLTEEKPADLDTTGNYRNGPVAGDSSTPLRVGTPSSDEYVSSERTSSATLRLPVINTFPEAYPDQFSLSEDSQLLLSTLLDNDLDADGDELNIVKFSQGVNGGTVTKVSENVFRYSPLPDYNGEDQISYTVEDVHGAQATTYVNFSIRSVNDLPLAKSDRFLLTMNQSYELDVLANDSGLGDSVDVDIISNTSNGNLIALSNGDYSYTPDTGFIGDDSFVYQITDSNGDISIATAEILVECADSCRKYILSWDASTSRDVVTYRVYAGIDGGSLRWVTDTGNAVSYEYLTNTSGQYQFAVSAVNSKNIESELLVARSVSYR